MMQRRASTTKAKSTILRWPAAELLMAGARVDSAGLGEVLAGGIDEQRPELVEIDNGVAI